MDVASITTETDAFLQVNPGEMDHVSFLDQLMADSTFIEMNDFITSKINEKDIKEYYGKNPNAIYNLVKIAMSKHKAMGGIQENKFSTPISLNFTNGEIVSLTFDIVLDPNYQYIITCRELELELPKDTFYELLSKQFAIPNIKVKFSGIKNRSF